MIHITFVCVTLTLVISSCVYCARVYKGAKRIRIITRIAQAGVVATALYAMVMPGVISSIAEKSQEVTGHSESIQLNDLTAKPMEFAESNVRVQLGRKESNGNTYYLVHDPELGRVKVPVDNTVIKVRPQGKILVVRYTTINATTWLQFLHLAGTIQSEKYTLYIAPGSADLVTRPDTEPYMEYLKKAQVAG